VGESYRSALAAAETALVKGERSVMAGVEPTAPAYSLRHLRSELGKAVEERPELLPARFDRFIEAVGAHSGFRIESARVHLEVGFDQVAETLVKSGALDPRSFKTMCARLDRAATTSRTAQELFATYREAVLDLCEALKKPARARNDRNLKSAVEFVHQHYAERLSRAKVAKVAGFAPRYFSRLFKRRERVTFEHYLRSLRLERAAQLLLATELDAARVAELSGFTSAQYFSRAFRTATGFTPVAYRHHYLQSEGDAITIEKTLKVNQQPRRRR
jgi:AraC-like DNA-binding protein